MSPESIMKEETRESGGYGLLFGREGLWRKDDG